MAGSIRFHNPADDAGTARNQHNSTMSSGADVRTGVTVQGLAQTDVVEVWRP